MALYLKAKKLDIETGDALIVLLNNADAEIDGLNAGDRVWITSPGHDITCILCLTDVEVKPGEIGFYSDVWEDSGLKSGTRVRVELVSKPKSVQYIAKKLQGKRLNEEEMLHIMQEISKQHIRSAEMAYFMATMFNPGFNDDEALYAIKGMVASGEVLDFKNIKNNGDLVVDKHSIGGIAGKGITPLLVPMIACFGLVIPNTSTRAITAPAGTTDILEVIMPVKFDGEEIYDIIRKTGALMIWGGNLKIAPADDILIRVEKGLHVQSYQKFIISIVAKKLAMGISHILIDLPYGKNTKIEDPDDVDLVSKSFKKMFKKVGINCHIYSRIVYGPDSRGVGPDLEIQEVLRILEDDEDKCIELEDAAVKMAGSLLEFVGKAKNGMGEEMVRDSLESGKVTEKFWEIAFAQGCKKKVLSKDIKVGNEAFDVVAIKGGKIKGIHNKEVVKICRALGTPNIKKAGMYFHKFVGDSVSKGDVILTLYSTTHTRLKEGKEVFDEEKLFKYR
jgi:AMP phosphorylase